MTRQEILNEISQGFGAVPGWVSDLPDNQLEDIWGFIKWEQTDTKLTAREKLLVAFGAAGGTHCPY